MHGNRPDQKKTSTIAKVSNVIWLLCSVCFVYSLPEDQSISALTTLGCELYVLYWRKNTIAVYDVESLVPKERWSLKIPSPGYATDMTSCSRHRYVYIAAGPDKCIHRYENECKKQSWWQLDSEPFGLSVSKFNCNLIVTFATARKIQVFTPDGEIVNTIDLHENAMHPWHAIQLKTGNYNCCC